MEALVESINDGGSDDLRSMPFIDAETETLLLDEFNQAELLEGRLSPGTESPPVSDDDGGPLRILSGVHAPSVPTRANEEILVHQTPAAASPHRHVISHPL